MHMCVCVYVYVCEETVFKYKQFIIINNHTLKKDQMGLFLPMCQLFLVYMFTCSIAIIQSDGLKIKI